jgi:hypothetical protein
MRKIIFLDVDGVMNSRETLARVRPGGGIIGIDAYLALIVDRIVQATGAEIVLSSSWRHGNKETLDYVRGFAPFIDITPTCCSGIRGCEIYKWTVDNIDYDIRDDRSKFRYAIIDDDSDMLLWQKDHFFKTSFDTGITPEIADRVISHLNG